MRTKNLQSRSSQPSRAPNPSESNTITLSPLVSINLVDIMIPWLELVIELLIGNIYGSPIKLLSKKLLPVLDLPTIDKTEYSSYYGRLVKNYIAEGFTLYPLPCSKLINW